MRQNKADDGVKISLTQILYVIFYRIRVHSNFLAIHLLVLADDSI